MKITENTRTHLWKANNRSRDQLRDQVARHNQARDEADVLMLVLGNWPKGPKRSIQLPGSVTARGRLVDLLRRGVEERLEEVLEEIDKICEHIT